MSVTFRSKQSYLTVAHENLFHCGNIIPPHRQDKVTSFDVVVRDGVVGVHIKSDSIDYDRLKEMGVPVPNKLYTGYTFMQGDSHDLLTLETEEEIEAMRVYSKTTGNLVVELDEDGNEPVDPEGTPFIAKIAGYVLYPAIYTGKTTAEGKIFYFNMGAGRNQYITADKEEIKSLRSYVKNTANCVISDPTYKDPFSEV